MSVSGIGDGIIAGWIENSSLGTVGMAISRKGILALEIGLSQEIFISRIKEIYCTELTVDQIYTHDYLMQIDEYLRGERQRFNMQIDWAKIPSFQKMVLLATIEIPYGETTTYGQIAKRIGKPNASRAVGRAEGTNPIPLVIPCHRVIGVDGSLRGYGVPGGVEVKAKLLRMEKGGWMK